MYVKFSKLGPQLAYKKLFIKKSYQCAIAF